MMKRQRSNRSLRAARFSLIEMLAVMVIMGLMMSIAMPAFDGMISGASVDSSATMLGAKVRQAQHFAIKDHRHVAVLMPRNGQITSAEWGHLAGRCFRICYVKNVSGNSGTFDGYVPGSQWNIIAEAIEIYDDEKALGDKTDDDVNTWVTGVWVPYQGGPDDEALGDCRALIFAPNGSLQGMMDQGPIYTQSRIETAIGTVNCTYFTVQGMSGRVEFAN